MNNESMTERQMGEWQRQRKLETSINRAMRVLAEYNADLESELEELRHLKNNPTSVVKTVEVPGTNIRVGIEIVGTDGNLNPKVPNEEAYAVTCVFASLLDQLLSETTGWYVPLPPDRVELTSIDMAEFAVDEYDPDNDPHMTLD